MFNTFRNIIFMSFILTCITILPVFSQPKVQFKFSNKDKATAHYNIGINFAKRGELEKAIKQFTISSQLDPDNFDVHYNLGVAYMKLGKYEEAVKAYKEAIIKKPDYASTYYNLAVALSSLDKVPEAKDYYLKAISYNPNLIEARANLAMIYFHNGEKEKFQEQLSKIEKIDPKVADMVKKATTPAKH